MTVLDDRDYTKDFLHLRYDPGKVTPGRIVEVIREQGFQGTVVPDPEAPAPDNPPSGGDAR